MPSTRRSWRPPVPEPRARSSTSARGSRPRSTGSALEVGRALDMAVELQHIDRRDIDNIRRRVVNIEKARRMLRWTPAGHARDRAEAHGRLVRRFALRRARGRHLRKSARGALGHGYHSPVTSLGQPLRWLWRAAVPAAPFLVGIAPIVALWAANRAEFPATVLVPLSIVVGGIAAGALLIGLV